MKNHGLVICVSCGRTHLAVAAFISSGTGQQVFSATCPDDQQDDIYPASDVDFGSN